MLSFKIQADYFCMNVVNIIWGFGLESKNISQQKSVELFLQSCSSQLASKGQPLGSCCPLADNYRLTPVERSSLASPPPTLPTEDTSICKSIQKQKSILCQLLVCIV